MFSHDTPINPPVDSKTYPLGEKSEPVSFEHALALVALSHTPVEHRLYSAMLSQSLGPFGPGETSPSFTARRLMTITSIGSLSTIRRALEGLLGKRSIEHEGKNGKREHAKAYRVFSPLEVIARR